MTKIQAISQKHKFFSVYEFSLIILILSSCSLVHLTMYFSLNLGSSQVKNIYIDFAYTYDQGIINL